MTAAALGLEIRPPLARIADEDTGRLHSGRWRRTLPLYAFDDAAHVSRNRIRIRIAYGNSGHSHLLPAAMNNRHDQFAVQVAECDLRSQKIRATEISAAQIRAMTTPAVYTEQQFAARYLRRIFRRTLLSGNEPAPARGLIWRRRVLCARSLCTRWRPGLRRIGCLCCCAPRERKNCDEQRCEYGCWFRQNDRPLFG